MDFKTPGSATACRMVGLVSIVTGLIVAVSGLADGQPGAREALIGVGVVLSSALWFAIADLVVSGAWLTAKIIRDHEALAAEKRRRMEAHESI